MSKVRKGAEMSPQSLQAAAECLRTLAHPQRLQIVRYLLGGKPITVGELAQACGLSQPQTSEHLRLMQRCGFLSSSKEGRKTFYTVVEPHLANIMNCIQSRFGGAPAAARPIGWSRPRRPGPPVASVRAATGRGPQEGDDDSAAQDPFPDRLFERRRSRLRRSRPTSRCAPSRDRTCGWASSAAAWCW